jgi:hypothetical protein
LDVEKAKGSDMLKNTLIKMLIGLIVFGLGLSALFLWMSGSNLPENERVQVSQPAATTSATSTLSRSVQGTPCPLNEQDQLRVTQMIEKLKQTPVIAAEVEQELKHEAAITPLPPVIDHAYPVNSVEDLPQVVYNYPLSEDREYRPCVDAKNPGAPRLITSLDKSPDYYMIPFFKNSQLCALATVTWKDGLGRLSSMRPADHLPFVEVSEAIALVEQFTGQKVAGTPRVVNGDFIVAVGARPFWQMTTADDQVYYVLHGGGMYEEGEYALSTSVIQNRHLQFSPYISGAPTATPFPQNPRWPLSPALANYSYPFRSYRDLAQVVYHYPLLESSGAAGDCIRAQHPGSPVMIGDDYYLIPFFQDNQVCAMAITYENDQRTVYLEAADRVDPAPYGDSAQVITLFEKAFGQKVQGTPILVNTPSPFQPFWKVTAADGQLYYVIFQSILNEDGRFSKTISIVRARNWQPAGK